MLSDEVKKELNKYVLYDSDTLISFILQQLLPQIESQERLMEEMIEFIKETKVTDIKSMDRHNRLMSLTQKYKKLKEKTNV